MDHDDLWSPVAFTSTSFALPPCRLTKKSDRVIFLTVAGSNFPDPRRTRNDSGVNSMPLRATSKPRCSRYFLASFSPALPSALALTSVGTASAPACPGRRLPGPVLPGHVEVRVEGVRLRLAGDLAVQVVEVAPRHLVQVGLVRVAVGERDLDHDSAGKPALRSVDCLPGLLHAPSFCTL